MALDYDPRESLLRELKAGRVAFVVGAGFSVASTPADAPASWQKLIAHGLTFASAIGAAGAQDIGRIEQLAGAGTHDTLIAAASEIETYLRSVSAGFDIWMAESAGSLHLKHPELRDALRGLNVTICTTNYDTLLSQDGGPPPIPWTDGIRSLNVLRGDTNGILHLHGAYDVPESIVFGDGGYDRIRADKFAQFRQQALATMRTLVFVGSGEGIHDPNMTSMFDWLAPLQVQHPHYRLVRSNERGTTPGARIIDVPYGNNFDDLPQFLEGLASDASTGRGRVANEKSESGRDRRLSELGPVGERLKHVAQAENLGQYSNAFVESCEALDDALSLPQHDEHREELVARARVACAGLILRVDGDPEEAFEMCGLTLVTGFMRSNPRARFSALVTRAESGILASRIVESRGALTAATKLAESDDERRSILQVEAHLCLKNEDFAGAAEAWRLAADQFAAAHALAEDDAEATRTLRGTALCWHNRGLALGRNGDLVGACNDLQTAADYLATISAPGDEAPCLYFLAEYQLRSNLFLQGFASLDRALEITATHRLDLWEMKTHELKARAYYSQDDGHRPEVLGSLYEASQIARRREDHDTTRRCLQMAATVFAENRQFDVALDLLKEAAAAAKSTQDELAMADVAKQKSKMEAKQPQPLSPDARNRILESYEQFLSRTVADGEMEEARNDLRAILWPGGSQNQEVDGPNAVIPGDAKRDEEDEESDIGLALRARLDTASTVGEAARVMMQLGGWHLEKSEPYEAGLWFSRAQEAANSTSLSRIAAAALVCQVVSAMEAGAYDAACETARLDEAAAALGDIRDQEVEAAIEFHRGRILAGEDQADAALVSFCRARDIASQVHHEELVAETEDWIRRLEDHRSLLSPAQLTFAELATELTELESWYPEEREALRQFWYYWRDEDLMKNAAAMDGVSKCLVMAHDAEELGRLRNGLAQLFDLIFYSSETAFVGAGEDLEPQLVPFPADRPLPHCVNVIGIPTNDAGLGAESIRDATAT